MKQKLILINEKKYIFELYIYKYKEGEKEKWDDDVHVKENHNSILLEYGLISST